MSRRDGKSFVLQDTDDVVHSPWVPTKEAGDLYYDQVKYAQQTVQSNMPKGTPIGHVTKLWDEQFFPKGYTIRYAMILLFEMIRNDVGFRWEHDCKAGMPPHFMSCFDKVLAWAATSSDAWPAPKQVEWAFTECKRNGKFDSNDPSAVRPPAPWRDFTSDTAFHISCIRSSDSVKETDARYNEKLSWCTTSTNGTAQVPSWNVTSNDRSCCRAKHDQPCYYFVKKQSACNRF